MQRKTVAGAVTLLMLSALCAWAAPAGPAIPPPAPAAPAVIVAATVPAIAAPVTLDQILAPLPGSDAGSGGLDVADLVQRTPAHAPDAVPQALPAVCLASFCSTNAQCTCPGSSCVNNVCTMPGGGGGGGGGGTCLRTFCSSNASCTCPTARNCINNICQ